MDPFFKKIQTANLYLLIAEFHSFTFNVIADKDGFASGIYQLFS